jgi:hypothetical protein
MRSLLSGSEERTLEPLNPSGSQRPNQLSFETCSYERQENWRKELKMGVTGNGGAAGVVYVYG